MLIATLCLLMGLAAMGISGFYSFAWFIQKGMPYWIALSMAIIYVGFANIVFEYSMGLFSKVHDYSLKLINISKKANNYKAISKRRNSYFVFAVLQFTGWLLLAAYSMYCTVGGQYDQLMNIEDVVQYEEDEIKDHSRVITMKEEQLSDYKEEAETVSSRLDSIGSVEDRYLYKNTTSATEERLDYLRNRIEELTLELSELYGKQDVKEFKEEFDISTRGFYVYVSEILNGYDPVMIQFYSSLFPSVVTDIISPICLTIFIQAWRKRKPLPINNR